MRGFSVKTGLKRSFVLIFALSSGLGLAACSDIDSMFGDDTEAAADAGPPPDAGNAPTTAPIASSATNSGLAPAVTITPVAIEAGSDTGTAVNKTIQSLRSQVSGLESKLAANAARLSDLRNGGAASASAYQQTKAQITTRLQVGTTKGNPELVSEWNSAQSSLDALSANINGLNALGTDIATDSSTAHFALDQIGATFNVSGAVDEDHRQLSLLQDETSQTLVMIDRLLSEVSDSVQRQTAYVANERGGLTTLAAAIKNGELYGGTPGITAQAASGGVQLASAGSPLVVIRFDHPGVDYQQNSLCRAEPGAAVASQCRLRSCRRLAHPWQCRLGADRPDHRQALRAGSHALDDRYGRARHAHGRRLVHRSGRRRQRSAGFRSINFLKRFAKSPAVAAGLFVLCPAVAPPTMA